MHNSKRIYLAGPNVFFENPLAERDRLVACCDRYGHIGLFPLDNQLPPTEKLDKAIFESNVALLSSSDMVIANLMPFRGPESDIGTVWEVAYAFAKGIPVHGYSHCNKSLIDKVKAGPLTQSSIKILSLEPSTQVEQHAAPEPRCINGWAIEDFGNPFNLMLMHSLTSYTVGDLEDVLIKLKKHSA